MRFSLLLFINLHHNEYSQEINYHPFAVKLVRCVGSCNTLNGLSNKVCIPNKTEDLNLSMLNMITGINESKRLTRHISCKCQFDGKKNVSQINGGIIPNANVSAKKIIYVQKNMFGILVHVFEKMKNI